MPKMRSMNEQIQTAQEELRQRENRLKELLQKKKVLERKERTHRLCERGAYLESILPDTVSLTPEQFKSFFDKVLLTGATYRALGEVAAKDSASEAPASGAKP